MSFLTDTGPKVGGTANVCVHVCVCVRVFVLAYGCTCVHVCCVLCICNMLVAAVAPHTICVVYVRL